MGRLDGKYALVTGASRGIGRAIATTLASEGAAIAIHYRTGETAARTLADELGAKGVQTLLLQGNVGNVRCGTRSWNASRRPGAALTCW